MTEINFLNIIQVLVAIALIGFILIQRGPGATAGSAFGGGASGTVFGAKGSGSFLTKSTAILATLFFIITMLIAIDASETFSSVDAASGEQDLGVFGTLEDVDSGPSVTPVGGTDEVTSNEALNDVLNTAEEQVAETVDAVEAAGEQVEQAAEKTAEEIKKATESEDSDGNN